MLRQMSNVAAAAFCAVHRGGRPQLFGFDSWRELSRPRDLEKIFDSLEYAKWNAVPRNRGFAVRHA